jgi:hypothetical protein
MLRLASGDPVTPPVSTRLRQTNIQTVAIPSSSESKEMQELLFIGAKCNPRESNVSLAVTDSLPVSMESVEREVQRREFDPLYATAFNS